jgi:acyl carrier protein
VTDTIPSTTGSTPLEEFFLEVRRIIADTLERPVAEVPLSADLEGGLGVDSLAMIEIGIALEERFRIAMPDLDSPDCVRLKTVEDLARLVAAQLVPSQGRRA